LVARARVGASVGPAERFAAWKGNSTLSSALFHGSKVGSWNMMPVSARGWVRAWPAMPIVPWLGASRPAIIIKSVLLPQPDGPRRATNSPALMANELGATASTCWRVPSL
jgi:hypothetical protein